MQAAVRNFKCHAHGQPRLVETNDDLVVTRFSVANNEATGNCAASTGYEARQSRLDVLSNGILYGLRHDAFDDIDRS
jgi:hypothetical protein